MSDRIFLSRLVVNPRSREARRDLADCMAMHRTLMTAFPDRLSEDGRARAEAGVLYRVESVNDGTVRLLVQSSLEPDWSKLAHGWMHASWQPESKEITDLLQRVESGRILRFKLVANPTRKIDTKTRPDGTKSNGRRVELRTEAEWLAWLDRKGAGCGFRLRSVRASAHVPDVRAGRDLRSTGKRPAGAGAAMRLTFSGVVFEGRLEVTDADLFRSALRAGIGAAKAYGHGLLSVAGDD